MFKNLTKCFKKNDEDSAAVKIPENIVITYDDHYYIRNPWWIRETSKYAIIGTPLNLQREDVQKTFSRAFQTWTTFISLKFKEVSENEEPDINFRFYGKDDNNTIIASNAYEFILDKDKKWAINMNGKKFDESGDDLYCEMLNNIGMLLKETGNSIGARRHALKCIFKYKPVNENGIYFQPFLSSEDIIVVKTLINEPYKITSRNG